MNKTRNEEDIKEVGEALEVTFRILIQGAGGLQLTFFFSFNYQEKTKSYKTCSQWFKKVLDACLVIYLQKMNPLLSCSPCLLLLVLSRSMGLLVVQSIIALACFLFARITTLSNPRLLAWLQSFSDSSQFGICLLEI